MNDSELSFDVPTLVSLSRQIELHLERLIVQGALKSGQRLSEPEIAKRFRTSRSPVREALRRLEQVGLVVIEPRRGASVKAPNQRDIDDMLSIREALEGLAARLAAERAEEADIARLQACAADPGQDDENPSLALIEFHEAVIMAARNPALQTMLRGSLNLFRMVRSIPVDHHARKARASDEHMAILDAIVARDPDAAEQAARRHIRTMRRQLLGSSRPAATPVQAAPDDGDEQRADDERQAGDEQQAGTVPRASRPTSAVENGRSD